MFFFDTWIFRASTAVEPGWHHTWPFGPGIREGFISVSLKMLFIAAILGGIAWVLRRLFGPGGPFRDAEFDKPDPKDDTNDPQNPTRHAP